MPFLGFAQQVGGLLPQHREIGLHDVPDERVPDVCVAMNKPIAKRDDFPLASTRGMQDSSSLHCRRVLEGQLGVARFVHLDDESDAAFGIAEGKRLAGVPH